MSGSGHRIRLTVKVIAAAKPAAKEYTLWDNLLAHLGVRVQPSGVRSYIVQTRVDGRMRKVTLGRFPELPARRGAPGGRLRPGPPVGRRGHCAGVQQKGAALPQLRGPLPRAARAALDAFLAQDLRQLPA